MDAAGRLNALLARCEADAGEVAAARDTGDALAAQVGGELELRWRIAVIRGVMTDPPDGDAVRELYGELVDRYRGDAASAARIKPLGDEIRQREREGTLPSAMVARTDRRKPR